MSDSDVRHVIYRFNGFQFDSVRESLSGPNGSIALRDQAGRVLKLLIERAPGIVSKDEILDEVWGHDALSESSIPQAIKDIRLALNDSAKQPEIIITRYGRGYQFVADLDTSTAAPETASTNAAAAAPKNSNWKVRWLVPVLVLALAAIILRWPLSMDSPETESSESPLVLKAVEAGAGESLSEPFVRYLGFVLREAMGSDRITIADPDETVDSSNLLNISLGAGDLN
ncbi:MAG: winged helix-turn-helix domain-containing protein, partial [Pseudomonadota bacterium]